MKNAIVLKVVLLCLLSFVANAEGLNCNESVTCSYVDKGHPFMVCDDGKNQEMCFLAAPATGVNFICPCDIVCRIPNNNLDNGAWSCQKDNQ